MKYKLEFENGQVFEGELDENTHLIAKIWLKAKPWEPSMGHNVEHEETTLVKEVRETVK
jgi:hypothetical protein